jgi:hypothetical protein
MQNSVGCLAMGLGDGELVHLLVIALLQIDDLALGRAGDQDHRIAVGGGMGQRRQTVEKAGRGYREADAGLLGQIAGDRRGVAGMLLMPERQHPHACGLHVAAEVGDRDARHVVNGLDTVELQGIDDQMEPVRQLLLGVGFRYSRRRSHGVMLPIIWRPARYLWSIYRDHGAPCIQQRRGPGNRKRTRRHGRRSVRQAEYAVHSRIQICRIQDTLATSQSRLLPDHVAESACLIGFAQLFRLGQTPRFRRCQGAGLLHASIVYNMW